MNSPISLPNKRLAHAVLLAIVATPMFTLTPAHAESAPSVAQEVVLFESMVPKLEERDEADAKRWAIAERMAAYNVPGTAVAIIQGGEIVMATGYGHVAAGGDVAVDEHTVFSAGSVSKMVNAALILRLVQAGKVDLDVDVNRYLQQWKVPDSRHSRKAKVTLRSLLSHTSGFSQHGFGDFMPGAALPTALQTLNGESPATHGRVQLRFTPGSEMAYSGGGITVSQVLVEDVTGLDYERAAREFVFEPLGMNRSTFANPLPESHGNIAYAHDDQGRRVALPRGYESMPEIAASGLWTSAHDMALFVQALLSNDQFLGAELRADMLTRVPNSWHGLGPRLNGSGDALVFHHGGANNSYRAWVDGQVDQQNGFVVLTNGTEGRNLAYELRISAQAAFGWPIRLPEHFKQPSFD